MKKINYEKLLYIFGPLILGGIVGFITSSSMKDFDGPIPSWIFPVVWSVLYILMGISSYLVRDDKKLIRLYIIQLVVNLLWSFIFFSFNLKTLAFFWILSLIVLVGIMMYEFYQKNKTSAYLLIPYIIWLVIAAFLNLSFIK